MSQVLHELWDFVICFTKKRIGGKILCAQILLHPFMDFFHTHSDHLDMSVTVNTGFCDVASFT